MGSEERNEENAPDNYKTSKKIIKSSSNGNSSCSNDAREGRGGRRGCIPSSTGAIAAAREERRLAIEEMFILQHRKADAAVRLQGERLRCGHYVDPDSPVYSVIW